MAKKAPLQGQEAREAPLRGCLGAVVGPGSVLGAHGALYHEKRRALRGLRGSPAGRAAGCFGRHSGGR